MGLVSGLGVLPVRLQVVTCTLTGTVFDPTGAGVSQASVTAKNTDTNLVCAVRGCKRDCANDHQKRRMGPIAIDKTRINHLLADYKKPEDIIGENGLGNNSRKQSWSEHCRRN
jgi:hypothetical protein